MTRSVVLLLLILLLPCGYACGENAPDKSVLIAILARNKAHLLPRYLQCIESQDYPKNLITIYIKTDNNSDNTKEILEKWAEALKDRYKAILFDKEPTEYIPNDTSPHEWNSQRFNHLALIRNKSLRKAKEYGADFYLVVDCDNFIAPFTLKTLVEKDKPIIAPLLRCIPEPNDLYANFFYACAPNGYYQDHPNHIPIIERKMVGTFKVDLVHCTYLIKSSYIDSLNYIDGASDYEFIIFSRYARKNSIEQYVTNEKEYGVQVHFYQNVSLEEEKKRLEAILTLP